eukprot:NODE_7922_length_1538_cov_5.540043.p6 GENE.NODE_7922_length_1538_cov_5.540043~~NODE_7922_length_1538_cov_5.540043.p6  ORF type:complete len:56 (-),score=11.42 NODE_7922_length_1538_cov_5.540043:1118-1285(-)
MAATQTLDGAVFKRAPMLAKEHESSSSSGLAATKHGGVQAAPAGTRMPRAAAARR